MNSKLIAGLICFSEDNCFPKGLNSQNGGKANRLKQLYAVYLESLWKTVSLKLPYIQNLLALLPLKLLKRGLHIFSSLFRQKYFKNENTVDTIVVSF